MIRKLARSVREYKTPSIITMILMIGEVVIECLIPFITANLIGKLQMETIDWTQIVKTGLLLVGLAILSLCCGGVAAFTASKASAGFAKNLRHDVFTRIQSFSFNNIDKFSTSSLVTRLTTDITNVQMSYMMIIRTAIRSPLMFIFAIIMAYILEGKLATMFIIVVPFLLCGLFIIARKAMPAFRRVFKKYDKLNESVEENVRGMRVVKGFSREKYETQKFTTAAEDICNDFTKADRIVALNGPLMNICMYFNMVFVLLVGSMLAIKGNIHVGVISTTLNYGMQILMSLMMLSMIYVTITISMESMKRICEVLDEQPTLANPQNPIYEVNDGSIEFCNVSFKYSKEAKKSALAYINLNIKSGITVGVIGGTGSSKS